MYTRLAALLLHIQNINSIILHPSPVATIRYGRQLILECKTNNEWVSLSWRKNVLTYVFVFNQNDCNTIENGNFLRATCDKRDNFTTSSLIDASPKSNDTWECLAVFPGNEIRQNSTKVDIIGPYVELSNQTDVLYGEPAELNCTVDPKWSRCTWKSSDTDEEIFSITSGTNITGFNYSLLCTENDIILRVEFPVHLASYECVGFYYTDDNLVSLKEKTTIIIYAEPPSLQISSNPLNPVEHFNFELLCIAKGRPVPKTSWITSTSEIPQSLGKSRIEFRNLNRTNSQVIACRATSIYLNKTMQEERQYNMTVLYPPEASIKGQTVNQSDTIQLECFVARGQPATYNVTGWDHRVEGKLIRKINITDTHLNFTKPVISDMGEYSCIVSNGVKDRDGNKLIRGCGNLSVLGSPSVVAGLKLYEIRNGEDVKIETTVVSFPPLKHARLFKTGSTGSIYMNLKRFMSYISFYGVDILLPVQNVTYSFSATPERTGQYTIEFDNKIFTANFSITIEIDDINSEGNYQEKTTDTTVVLSLVFGVSLCILAIVTFFYLRRAKCNAQRAGEDNSSRHSPKTTTISVKRLTMLLPFSDDEGAYITPDEILDHGARNTVDRSNTESGNKESTGESSFPKMCEQQREESEGYLEMDTARVRDSYVSMKQPQLSVMDEQGSDEINTEQSKHYEEIKIENSENNDGYETIKENIAAQTDTDLRVVSHSKSHQTTAPYSRTSSSTDEFNDATPPRIFCINRFYWFRRNSSNGE